MKTDIYAQYCQAQELMQGLLTSKLVKNDAVFPHWIEDSCSFWYVRETDSGKEFVLVDAPKASVTHAFDHGALAASLAERTGVEVDALDLPIVVSSMSLGPLKIHFCAFNRSWQFCGENKQCEALEEQEQAPGLLSPDGRKLAFVENHNLHIRNMITGETSALTVDGAEHHAYADHMIKRGVEDVSHPQGQWSPDSSRFLTVQVDLRNVTTRAVVDYSQDKADNSPSLMELKMASAGEKHVESCELIAIDTETGHIQRAQYGPLVWTGIGSGFFNDKPLGWWSNDGRRCFFIDVNRGANVVRVVAFCTETGATNVLFEETSDTFIQLSHYVAEDAYIFVPLLETDELIWFSERDGWGHLYLYDLCSGELKKRITEGEWIVRGILHYDAEQRELLVQTAGRDKAISPYYRDICKLHIDTGKLTTLLTENADYGVFRPSSYLNTIRPMAALDSPGVDGISPNGDYLVTTYSRVDTAPVSVLVNRQGEILLTLEVADVANLPEGWVWPEPVRVTADDGETDIYGVVYFPPNFSSEHSYPVIDFSAGVRHYSFVPKSSFVNGSCFGMSYLTAAAYAALGFIVVALDGRGTPGRHKAFQDHCYGDVGSTSDLNDRIAGLRQLAQRYPSMDLERVGITGLDDIALPVYAMLTHPEFYKVAVLHCFVEPRDWWAAHAETYDALSPNESVSHQFPRAEDLVTSLQGKLLLIQGMLDPMGMRSTCRLVNALKKANKDFDMLMLPDTTHDIPTYALRRSWDYFVKHLQGNEPPKEFALTTGYDLLLGKTKAQLLDDAS